MIDCFLAIDFDGTIAETDVTDAVLTRFASREWLAVEELWLSGAIGSRECLTRQIALVNANMATVFSFIDRVKIDRDFARFVEFIDERKLPGAVISDGFAPFIRRILAGAGIDGMPVYANGLAEENGRLQATFPESAGKCSAGTCKCALAERVSGGRPVVLIGDSGSDFCLASKASFVFAKDKLAAYCRQQGIPHYVFADFGEVIEGLRRLDKAVLRIADLESERGFCDDRAIFGSRAAST
jgi:2-hydroxy-3-keto-5-methylthiopentenyl-1-phosphate phosphatase